MGPFGPGISAETGGVRSLVSQFDTEPGGYSLSNSNPEVASVVLIWAVRGSDRYSDVSADRRWISLVSLLSLAAVGYGRWIGG